jgi:transposase-like protein
LAARRDTAAAKRFFRKALAQPHTVNPRTLTVDTAGACHSGGTGYRLLIQSALTHLTRRPVEGEAKEAGAASGPFAECDS